MSNRQFGKLTIISRDINDGNGYARWLCRCECGTEKVINGNNLRSGRIVSCGCYLVESVRLRGQQRVGPKNPRWNIRKQSRRTTAGGYISVRNVDYPGAPPWAHERLEHIVIMSRHLNRQLLPDETVHHKNGIRTDNRIENLEIRVRSKHPMGANTEDLKKWAKEILIRYPD